MRVHVIVEKPLFNAIDRISRLLSHLFEPDQDEQGTANMVALDTSQTTLATLNPGDLFGFAVKLLDLPAQGAHLLRALDSVLSHIIGGDMVRALGGEHQPEEFQL